MQQVWISKAGSPEVLRLQEAPTPSLRSGEVRIRVEACGVNFADILGRMDMYPDAPPIPYVPGYEVAGTVEAVGGGAPDLKEGDKVFALTRFGGYSNQVIVPHRQVFKRLDWMSAEHGAALPVNYLTAYVALMVMGSLRAGDKVLIHAAAGGVGVAALDICTIVGAESYGTASPEKHDFLLERGLHHPIDYRNLDYERVVNDLTGGRGVQIVLDPLGGVHWPKNYRLLTPTGRLIYFGMSSLVAGKRRSLLQMVRQIVMLPFHTPIRLMSDNKGVLGLNLGHLWEETALLQKSMRQIVNWYDQALFRPYIDQTFPLAEADKAHHYLQDRKNLGKVLLIPQAEKRP